MPRDNEHNVTPGAYRSKRARYASRAWGGMYSRNRRQKDNTGRSVPEVYDGPLSSSHSSRPPAARQISSQRDILRKINPQVTLAQSPLDFATDASDFNGPTSTEYTFNAVNGRLRAMGMQSAIPDKTFGSHPPLASGSSRLAQYGPFIKLLTMDPLWDMTRDNAQILIDDWCDGLGSVYPIVGRQTMLDTANRIFDSLDEARLRSLRETGDSVAEALFNHDTNKLKIVLAIGMTKQAGGREHQAQRLFQSTSEAVEGLIWNPEGLQGIQLLFLVAMYHYHLNEEVRTGRCIAFAARLCLETGLHRRAMLEKMFPDTPQCLEALHAFWAVYMLERRLSLGQGIPFSIQDSYIDRSIFTIDLSNPLLVSLLQWTRLAGKTWHALDSRHDSTHDSRADEINFLDYEIMDWFNKLPKEFKLEDISTWALHPPTYYHSVFFVRKAHLRNLIHRPFLQLPVKEDHDEPILLKAIELAKDTVRTLFYLNEQTSLIRTHPMFFQQLLLTAFGNLLLAVVSTGPKIQDGTREEFDMFLQLFQLLSSDCSALRRTWHRLQGLRDLHSKLGQSDHSTDGSNEAEGGHKETTLSFDDIFPNVNLLFGQANNFDDPNQSDTQSENQHYLCENFVHLENYFDFPFIGFGNIG
ncbi:hypothetical protein OPT61_g5795 [Boeremia exigua]|uniref:Uncharacterized protein n=1 Tax=Boeremia exigua TaxID=749465 RepID=A0ACC2I931_9PLEO|nr:hypothetical protein OPT61_g5795 [Boeremia exigua]